MASSPTVLCPACCGESPAGQRYCGACGAAIDRRAAEPVDEIRTATVLFADVADFTEMSAELGLETIKSLMDRVFERLYRVVLKHGGVVDKYIGDCVMALFGAPVAFGDDAARAVHAAFAIQRSLSELNEELPREGLPPVAMRVGINTGPVIAGAVGAGPQRRYTVLGDTVNVAAHLQRAAPRAAVVIGEGTFRRVRGLFDTRPLREAPRPAHLVLRQRFGGMWLRPREILGTHTAMVGRGGELARLLALVEQSAARRQARLALVVGAAGVGKSRLGTEFLSEVERRWPRAVRLLGVAEPLSQQTPFGVVADVIRRRLELPADQPGAALRASLRALLQLGPSSAPGDEEVLARVLGREDAAPVSPQQFAQRSTQLLSEIVRGLSDGAPVVVVIDDLHWCDGSTVALIDRLLAELDDRPLTIVGLARPEGLEEGVLLRGTRREALELGPLDAERVGELLGAIVGRSLGRRLLPLVDAARGNPYHVEELLRSLEERGVLVRQVHGWRLDARLDAQLEGTLEGTLDRLAGELGIPPGIEAVTQVRIDNLPATQRQLLREAAVIGCTFWEGALRAVSSDYSPLDLSALVQRELVIPLPDSRFATEREYRFAHDLTHDIAYRMTPEAQRTVQHRRIAEWLEAQGAQAAEDLALIAHHRERAGDAERAAEVLTRAGEAAHDAAAFAAARAYFDRALQLTRDRARLFELYAQRERVLNALGCWEQQLADATRLSELATSDDQRAEALLRLGRARLNLGDHGEARRVFEAARELAERGADQEGQARALRWLAMVHFNRGEHAQAVELFERALSMAERGSLETLAAELAYELGVAVGTVGDYVQAVDVSRRALQMYRQQGNRYQESFCLGNLGCFHVYLGEYEQAVELLEQAAALGRQMGIPLAEASAQANLGNALRQIDRAPAALELEMHAREVGRRIGDARLEADAQLYGALAAVACGGDKLALAEMWASELLQRARDDDLVGTEAAAAMALATVFEARGEREAALSISREAVQTLERVGSVEGLEAEIRWVHGRLCLRAGHDQEGRQTLEKAQAQLQQIAARIWPAARAQRFLTRVPANAGITALLEKGDVLSLSK